MVDLPPGFRVAQPGSPAMPPGFRVAAHEDTAQSRYDAALSRVRGLGSFKDWPDEAFNAFAKAKLQPYGAQELAQNAQIFSLGDEIAAGSSAATDQVMKWLGMGGEDFAPSWQAWQELQSARQALGREKAGAGGTAAEIGGALTSLGATLAPKAVQAANTFVNALKGGGAAATEGAAYGFGSTDGDLGERGKGALTGALIAAPIGAAGATVAKGIETAVNAGAKRAAAKNAPKAADIIDDSRAAYTAADTADVAIRPQATSILKQDLNAFLQKDGAVLPNGKIENFPKVRKAMKQLDAYAASDMTIPQFQRFEEAVQAAAASSKPGEARLGKEMLKLLDGYIESLPDTAYRGSGKGTDAAANWAKGKQLYAQGKRTKAMEKLIYDARFSGNDDFAGSLRQGFAAFLRNDKKRRGFSPDEIAAIERFVQGGPIGGVMKALAQGGGLPGGVWGGMAAGPAGAIAAPVVGAAARAGLNRGAGSEADFIRSMVSGGIPQPSFNLRGSAAITAAGSNPLTDQPRGFIEDLLFAR